MTDRIAAALLASGILIAPAQATITRAWISGKGTDQPSCGPIASPCRTLQYVHDTIVSAGGEIDVLDPAGYGAIIISKALNIVNDGAGVAGVLAAAGADAITINAGTNDDVVLRGLTIEGAGVGRNGIVFNTGRSLAVDRCVAQGFVTVSGPGATGTAVILRPVSGSPQFSFVDTTLSNNQGSGLLYEPPSGSTAKGQVKLDHVIASQNFAGILFDNSLSTMGVTASFSHTIAAANGTGFAFTKVVAAIDSSEATGNSVDGLLSNIATVHLSRSVIANNQTGVHLMNGAVIAYKNNVIDSNAIAINGGTLLSGTLE